MNPPTHSTTDYLLESLTAPQREAVVHMQGPQLILAGPGSGKTRVVTHRLAHLVANGVSARRIVALTFTNKAADEMRGRAAQLAPGEPFWISTFHRFCSRLLRQHATFMGLEENFTIYDTSDSRRLLKQVILQRNLDTRHYTPDRIAAAISTSKNNLITADKYEARAGSPLGAIMAEIYPAYQERLLLANAVDFDDLLTHIAVLLRENPEVRQALDSRFQYILVDEYQDTNLAQYLIIRSLSVDHPNLSVTGDPDQAIYGWRGANLNNILNFEKDYPEVQVVRLERNYRSTKKILRVADELISHNTRRKKKRLYTENDEGQRVRLVAYANQKDEAREIAGLIASRVESGQNRPNDFCILYRINALSRELEHGLSEFGVPYQLVNGVEFFQRREVKDVMAYLHLINNPRNDVGLLRVINTPARGIGKKTIERISDHARRFGATLLEAARESGLIESLNRRATVQIAKFVTMFDRLCEHANAPVEEIIGHVLDGSKYAEYLQQQDEDQDEERLANIQELLTAARQFDEQHSGDGALEAFLEQASLVNDTDRLDSETDCVTLMTIHSSKGLEYPTVFIIATESSILPHERCREDPDQLEEERRLLFVAITRAQSELQLSMARYREFRGQRRMSVPSEFLMEIPRDDMELINTGPAERSDWHGDVADDDEPIYFESDPAASSNTVSPTTASSALHLTTAAEMDSETKKDDSVATPTDAFYQGMLVKHPEYGLGKIVALSGSSSRRMATVNFVTESREKKFMLENSCLRPAK